MTMPRQRLLPPALIFLLWIVAPTLAIADAPAINPADDAKHFGDGGNILFWTAEQKVAGFRNMDKIVRVRELKASTNPYPLPYRRKDLGQVKLQLGEEVMSVEDYFHQQNVAGLLVIKDGQIVYERYGLGNTEDSLWVSFSVSKSVTAMLVGAAIQDGFIESLDEKVTDYLPRLKGSPYQQSTIRNILQMASGVEWNEDYADRQADINQVQWETLSLYKYLNTLEQEHPPGEVFNYNTAETNLVGNLLRSAIGNNLSTYATEKIWQAFGMEADANWELTEAAGGEFGGCCISASLRDYGRIGLLALHEGQLRDGTRILPKNWMHESTMPSKGHAGYGYLWWLLADGSYQAIGIFGQGIRINRENNVVIALQSAREAASDDRDWALQNALFDAITDAVSNQGVD
jgi:CubicO group peptidase (beta-lactamase class C family)